jgi:TolB protein
VEANNADYFNLYRMNPDGTGATAVTNDSYSDFNPAWSPDHCQIAFYSHRGEHDENIYVIAPDGTGLRRLTDNTGVDRMPTWSPDGTRIAYISGRNGQLDLYVMNADGKKSRQLSNTPEDDRDPEWSPADNRIVYEQLGGENHGIWVADADQGTPRMLSPKSPSEVSYLWPTWSPDGTRIACVTNVTIRQSREIAILNADGTGTQSSLMLPEEYGSPEFLSWSPDGKSIVHYNTVVHCPGCGGDEDILVIEITSRQITNLTDRPDGQDRDPDW